MKPANGSLFKHQTASGIFLAVTSSLGTKAHALALRERVVKFIKLGSSKTKAARHRQQETAGLGAGESSRQLVGGLI
jgi:hypothetical protein